MYTDTGSLSALFAALNDILGKDSFTNKTS
jgi:hypothetical protein